MALRVLLAIALALAAAGCATGGGAAPAGSSAPHARCLSEPRSGPDRPLFFLFCVQSP
jgi:hypothetical protein